MKTYDDELQKEVNDYLKVQLTYYQTRIKKVLQEYGR